MTFGRILLVTALATGACAKQGQVRTQLPQSPAPDIYHLCSDARFQSMCTPVQDQQPTQVDTNMTSPRALSPFAG